jgi:hypothetical protein
MENIPQLINEQFLDQFYIRRFRALGVDRRAVGLGLPDLLKRRRFHQLPLLAFIPRPSRVDLSVIALPVESLKN